MSHRKIQAYEKKLTAKMAEIKQRMQQESEQRYLEMHQEMLACFEADIQSLNATQAEADELRADLESVYQKGLQDIRQDYQQDSRILKVSDDVVINLDEMVKRQAIIELQEEGAEPPKPSMMNLVIEIVSVGMIIIGMYVLIKFLPYIFEWLNL
ncbi:hypothetical protein [Psychrobacter sp. I-STPA6b]|uniref:hypothetical protein n=1 Tax=Psychrobacter sp. I-STPA6b TaxID=2585718 RepID=UPI001D0CAAEF|nr:hypothetical protein [Psychrobacter sp. I-STPA6b]